MREFWLKELQLRVTANRDQKAYKDLLVHFCKPLFSYSLLIVRTPEAAKEVVSDVMFSIWNLGKRLLKMDNLTAYLHRTTKKRSLNCSSAKQQISGVKLTEYGLRIKCSNANLTEAMQTAEIARRLADAILALSPKCGFTYKQAAAALHISENTVDRHLYRESLGLPI